MSLRSETSDNVIEIKNMSVAYSAKPVLWEVDLQIPNGVCACVLGPNGAGKSTLIKGMLGLQKPLLGEVKFFDKPFKEVYKKVAYIPQKSDVNWDFPTTVLDVTLMGRYSHRGWIRRTNKQDLEIAKEALSKMGMLDFKDRQISQLSGGQRQRVFLARALAQEADLYILDEPLAGVDAITEAVVINQLKTFAKEGKSSLVVHHDLHTVREYFDYVIFIKGRVVAAGPFASTFTHENIERCFGQRMARELDLEEQTVDFQTHLMKK